MIDRHACLLEDCLGAYPGKDYSLSMICNSVSNVVGHDHFLSRAVHFLGECGLGRIFTIRVGEQKPASKSCLPWSYVEYISDARKPKPTNILLSIM